MRMTNVGQVKIFTAGLWIAIDYTKMVLAVVTGECVI